MKLSLCLATFNEEQNIAAVLESAKDIVDEIIIVDGTSTDKTVEIAKSYGAKVTVTDNPSNFHINKQKAIERATGDWILQLDADERVSKELGEEIKKVLSLSKEEVEAYEDEMPNKELFARHQALIDARDGNIGKQEGEYVAFYIPRKNYFLGTFLRYGGVYPDGVIRLIKRGKASLPAKDVHEVMKVDGRVGWLQHDLLHFDSPTFARYIARNNRYVNLMVEDMKKTMVGKGPVEFVNYVVIKPIVTFLLLEFRHKGILDGLPGTIFAFFSALRFARAYLRYLRS